MELKLVKKGWIRIFNNLKLPDLSAETYVPAPEDVFNCFSYFEPSETKVVIIGQDPYPNPKVTQGLSFSTKQKAIPQSLQKIFKEIENTLQISNISANLEPWAVQNVLLLNKTLTVVPFKSNSHKLLWQGFCENIIQELSNSYENIVFMLWGNSAISLKKYINQEKHLILESGHPSPLNRLNNFLGNNHFALANAYLKSKDKIQIIWKT